MNTVNRTSDPAWGLAGSFNTTGLSGIRANHSGKNNQGKGNLGEHRSFPSGLGGSI
jgi:hypothetical protein